MRLLSIVGLFVALFVGIVLFSVNTPLAQAQASTCDSITHRGLKASCNTAYGACKDSTCVEANNARFEAAQKTYDECTSTGGSLNDCYNKAGKAATEAIQEKLKTEKDNSWCANASTCLTSVVYMFTVGFASALAYVGSSVFNLGVQMSLQSAAYSQLFLTSGWAAARDIANMLFIFILIYIAVTIIYSAETHGTMKTLAAVVVMALLINFSFFITRVVVDAGNILAVQFYNAIPAQPLSQTAANGSLYAQGVNAFGLSPGDKKDLTHHLMGAVKVQNILGQDSFRKFTDQHSFLTNVIVQITVFIMVGWIFAILALSFFVVGFKFIVRIVILWFVIIAAPLAFAARAFVTNDIARRLYNEWQSALLKFSFYPAIFLFIFLIMNYILQEMGRRGGLVPDIFTDLAISGTDPAVSLGAAMANVLVRLGFVVIMLLLGLKAADQLVLHGSSQAEKFTSWASGKVMGWAENKRFAGLAYRESIGRAANLANKNVEGAKWASQPGVGGWFGTGLRTKVLAPIANKGFGGTRSFPQVLKDRDTRLNERKAQLKKITDKEKVTLRDKENRSLVDTLKMVGPNLMTDVQKRRIAGLNDREIAALDLDHLTTITSYAAGATANFWNDRKMKALESLEKHSDADREQVFQTWEAAKAQHATQLAQAQQTAAQIAAQAAAQAQQTNQPPPPTPQPVPHTPVPNTPGYVQTPGGAIMPNPTAVASGSTSRGNRGGGGGRSDTGTRSFQNLPEIDVMGRDLGRRARAMPNQTGGFANSWNSLEKKTAAAPELLGLEKALTGIAEIAAKAESRAATQSPATRSVPINRTPTPVSTLPTKTIPSSMTHSMPVRVSQMNPAQNPPTTPTNTEIQTPARTSETAQTPTPSTPKASTQNPSWWSTPPKDPAVEQLHALHGIRDAVEKQSAILDGMTNSSGNSGSSTSPVTINQTVVQVGDKTSVAMTPEAKQLLQSIQKGGKFTTMTPSLRRIFQENGIPNSDISQKTLAELLEQLKKGRA